MDSLLAPSRSGASPRSRPPSPDLPAEACGEHLDALVTADGAVFFCTHGPDRQLLPSDDDHADDHAHTQEHALAQADVPAGPVPEAPPTCYGNGTDGRRVEVLYLHDGTDRFGELEGDLRRWVGQVEWTFAASAARTGGRRHVRWQTGASPTGGCQVAIAAVEVTSAALVDFSQTIEELRARGFRRDDRKYLVFADAQAHCGIATVPVDDQAGQANLANHQAGYGRVNSDCWEVGDQGLYSVAAHELTHMLGAVQPSAPHSTDSRHCTDQYDVMCYADGAGVVTTLRCEDGDSATRGDGDANNRLLDCGNDDYFHTSPSTDSYLATHWNVARSLFLERRLSDGPGYGGPLSVEEDPLGRPMVWPTGTLGGPHRPVLPDAYGWEACDLPVEIEIDDAEPSSGGGLLAGLLGGGSEEDGTDLGALASGAASVVNNAFGHRVVRVQSGTWDGGEVPDGTAVWRWGELPGAARIELVTGAARIRAATVTLDRRVFDHAPGPERATLALQALAQSLGVGRVGGTGDLMSPYPAADASRQVAMAALRHLYDQPCSVDPRLSDTAPGHRTQRHPAGMRERVSLGGDAGSVSELGLSVAAWLRGERGDRWARRAVVCRDDVHADCLAGAALAGSTGPVVFVPGGPDGRLPGQVATELDRSLTLAASVVILGGERAVSPEVETSLRQSLPGRQVSRLGGDDRFETAVEVARAVAAETAGRAPTVAVARADEPADAVAVGAAAARHRIPVLLTSPGFPEAATQLALGELQTQLVLLLGGESAIEPVVEQVLASRFPTVSRVAGRTRSETSVAIAQSPSLWDRAAVEHTGSVIALNGWHPEAWAVALAAAPVGAWLDAPVLFTRPDGLPDAELAGDWPGDVWPYLRDLPMSGEAPTVVTVFAGSGRWSAARVEAAFHAAVLPGFDGNVTVTRR